MLDDQYAISVPQALISFAVRNKDNLELNELFADGLERRAKHRQAFAVPAVLLPVDDDLLPLAKPIAAATRDLMLDGVGLVVEEPLMHDLFAAQFTVEGQDSILLLRLLWSRPMGPYNYAGFRALNVLKTLPTAAYA